MKLTKEDIKKVEDLGWDVRENTKDLISIRNFSPAGEDMTIEVNDKEELINVCENFDVDEHFELWYGANRGEPSTPRKLLEDCEAQEKMYEALAEALK